MATFVALKTICHQNQPTLKKLRSLFFALTLVILTAVQAQDANLMLKYSFNLKAGSDSILDETGNGYNGKLNGSATVKTLGAYKVLQIGSTAGYLDLQSKLGNLVKTLSD